MDVLRAQLARMQEQLGALSASQKMLAASLVAIMVLTLLFWGRYAGTADMEAVLDQPLKNDEISRITAQIRSKGIDYKIVNDRIMVPTDRKLEVLADLSYLKLVPDDTRSTYDEIIKRINPWSSQTDNDATRNDAKARYLAQVIRKWPGVASADVIIDPTNERRLGGGSRQPTATVLITTHDPSKKRVERSLIDAAAWTVVGAQSGLSVDRISVIVNGARHTVNGADSLGLGGGDEILIKQQEAEQFFAQKISQQLSWIGGVLVAVTVDVNIESRRSSSEQYDPKNVVSKEKHIENDDRQETGATPAAVTEPGAFPNAPLAVGPEPGAAGGSGGSSTNERSVSEFENRFGKTMIESATPAGKPRVVRAAVRVPRSYFVGLYKINSASAKEPDDAALAPLIAAELPKIRNDVKGCTFIDSDNDISVEAYNDTMPLMAAATTIASAASGAAPATSGVVMMLEGHVKEIAIGVLALVSLYMLSSMVKKTSPAPIVAAAMEVGEAPPLASDEEIAGDVGEGNATLDGMELDADAVRAQQMVEQVATMVKENPEGAANLVKRWLNRT